MTESPILFDRLVGQMAAFFAFSVCFSYTSALDDNGAERSAIAVAYAANVVTYNLRHSDKIRHAMRVVLSPHGVRVERKNMFGRDGQGIYLQQFDSRQSWISDPKRKMFASLLQAQKARENDNHTKTTDSEWDSAMGGLMSTEPCLGLASEQRIVLSVYNQSEEDQVVNWLCNNDGHEVKQSFSHRWSTVVREEWPNLDVIELRDIKAVDKPKEFFQPSDEYREVSLLEFHQGAPELDTYLVQVNHEEKKDH